MQFNWKKSITITLDIVLAAYLVLAFTAFNKPDETTKVCTKVSINIQDESANGFISANEIKSRLEKRILYPLNKQMHNVNSRNIEEALKTSPFVNTAECYKTQDGHVYINITQRLPIVRVKAVNGDDYYLDDKNCIMPNSHYTSDLIIATGYITKWFAQNYVSYLSMTLMNDNLWKNQIEQINVLPDHSIELVPRVGNHIVLVGPMPESKHPSERKQLVCDFVKKKMDRLEKFYKYGLSQAGWNKYSYINIEFDNQIICKKREHIEPREVVTAPITAKTNGATENNKTDESKKMNTEMGLSE